MDKLEEYKNNLDLLNLNIFNVFENIIEENTKYENKIKILNGKLKRLQEEYENYGKVSIIKNINSQLNDKNNEIRILTKENSKLSDKVKELSNRLEEINTSLNNSQNNIPQLNNNNESYEEIIELEKNNNDNVECLEHQSIELEEESNETELENHDHDEEDEDEVDGEVEGNGDGEVEENGDGEVEENGDGESNNYIETHVQESNIELESHESELENNEDEEENNQVTDEESNDHEEDEVVEIEFYEKKLKCPKTGKRKTFLISDDENREIYELLDNDEVGDNIGKLTGKNNRPFFINDMFYVLFFFFLIYYINICLILVNIKYKKIKILIN